MKTDTYTKVILTIIAVVLTLNLIKGNVTPAMADSKKFATVPLNDDGSINVRIKHGEKIDVNVEDISAYAFSRVEPLKVKVQQ